MKFHWKSGKHKSSSGSTIPCGHASDGRDNGVGTSEPGVPVGFGNKRKGGKRDAHQIQNAEHYCYAWSHVWFAIGSPGNKRSRGSGCLRGMSTVLSDDCTRGQLGFVKARTPPTIQTDLLLQESHRLSWTESVTRVRLLFNYSHRQHAMGSSSPRRRPNHPERALIVYPSVSRGRENWSMVNRVVPAWSRLAPGRSRSDE